MTRDRQGGQDRPYSLRVVLDADLGKRLALAAVMRRTKQVTIIREALRRELDRLEHEGRRPDKLRGKEGQR